MYFSKVVLSFLILISSISVTKAGGFKIGLQSQKAIGMAHTGTALALDASAVYFNMGALPFLSANNLAIGSTFLLPSTSYKDNATQIVNHANKALFTPFSIFYNHKINSKLSAGLGIYTPFGSGISYPADWAGRYILTNISLQTIFVQPTLAYKVNKNIGIGAGFIYSTGNFNLERDLPIINQPNGSIAHAQLSGATSGLGFNIGAFANYNPLTIGLVYRSKINMNVAKGDAIFTNIPVAASNSFKNTTFTTQLPLPSEISGGIAYNLTKQLLVTADYNFTFWQSFDSLGFDYNFNSSSLTDDKQARLYKNAGCTRIGAQYLLNKKIAFRLGCLLDNTPVQNNYVNPDLPDNNKIGATAGISYAITPKLMIDASLAYENVLSRNTTNISTNLSGTYKTQVLAPGIGLSFNFNKKKGNK
jgi:long-chain fatty acid transport protein